jgi:membrane-associated phospholipid phosphatase
MHNELKSGAANGSMRRIRSNLWAWFVRFARAPHTSGHSAMLRWTPRHTVAGAGVILAALVLVTVLLDVWAVTQVRHLPERVVVVFDVITDFGKSGWFLFPLGGCLITIAAVSPLLPRASMLVLASVAVRVGFLFTAIAVPGLFTTVIKHVIGRARPYVTGVADAYAYSPFNWRVEYASFPSGHATTALAAAVAIGTIWPRARVVMWIYAIGIGVSRVVVTSHYPSDVIASAVVGVLGALLVRNYFAARRLGITMEPDGSVHAFAGPSLRRVEGAIRDLFTRPQSTHVDDPTHRQE